ncbi:tetratricopeptide repeat protein [Frateuria defendens]|uniref:tetratricopeptide repeat protein n=1 Tax=Frateuria defendens TaxID=2219559 RepID=UPI0009E1E1F6|nr:tetratricopeptide repeat protein [Frateuria defendens]
MDDAQSCTSRLHELDARGEISRAVELCESELCSENVDCQRYLGWFYANNGNPERACDWYRKAAMQGSAEAIEEYWKCVLMIDARGNKQKAIELCQIAPFSAHVNCQRYLAKAFFEKGDVDATLQWCLRLAEHGSSDDILYVGRLYLSKNEPRNALEFLKRAAMQGSARASQLIGEIYAFGIGVPKDEEMALPYYKAGAEHGLILSQMRLLHLCRHNDAGIGKLASMVRLFFLITRAIFIRFRNAEDPRIADIPQ